jgi:hypothetical protein
MILEKLILVSELEVTRRAIMLPGDLAQLIPA